MRRLFWQMSVTLDGFMEGSNRELDHTAGFADADFDRYATDMLKSIDAILLGRRTYQPFAGYWPSATGPDADRMNALPKIVFSRTLERLHWNNSRLVKENVADEVGRLKRQRGQDLALFKDIQDRIPLKLSKATTWSSGIAALFYQPQPAGA